MTNVKAGSAKFLKNVVETASPMQLVIILYDGAIQWLRLAKEEITNHANSKLPDWTNFAHQMRMATAIIDHLEDSLDHNQSQAIAERLSALYAFMKNTLLQANIKKNSEKIDQVIELLKNLKSHWQELIKQAS